MENKCAKKLYEIINQIKMTPITAPLVSTHTINHLLMCVNELEKTAQELEKTAQDAKAEKEAEADEGTDKPE